MKARSPFSEPDELVFAPEELSELKPSGAKPWKIIVADDDEEVHKATRLVLRNYAFNNCGLDLFSAYSGEECVKLITQHPDTALILLDVVMEKQHSGLEVVRHIRRRLKNSMVRIVLRTGYPGQAPERKVIMEYDINDYIQKSELTAQRLFTVVTASLRAYNDLRIIEKNRQALGRIIDSSGVLFTPQPVEDFAICVMTRLCSILGVDENGGEGRISALSACGGRGGETVVTAGCGDLAPYVNSHVSSIDPPRIKSDIEMVINKAKGLITQDYYAGYFQVAEDGPFSLVYLTGLNSLNELDKGLVQVFSTSAAMALSNLKLNQEIVDTQKEIIVTLGEVVETRSRETAHHVKRVAECSSVLAGLAGLARHEVRMLRLASPMHDVGKIGIPDSILLKPGPPTREEYDIMKSHALLGYQILAKSNRDIIRTAAVIALEHHERWDGQGYPQGLRGEEIHIYSRITALIDVFDALYHKRVYKEPWDLNNILEYITNERGKHFDPNLVDIFLDNLDKFLSIYQAYPDRSSDS